MQPENLPNKRSKYSALAPLILVVLLLGIVSGWVANSYMRPSAGLDFASLNEIAGILEKKYDGKIDTTKLLQGAKVGLTAATGDPYTTYLSAEQAKELEDDLEGNLSGIGIEVGIKNTKLVVIAPIQGSPAAQAGLLAGDQIIFIDSVDTSTLTLDEAVKKIRGPKGTNVKLTILRPANRTKEVTITRDIIKVDSIKSELKDGGVGYIKIAQFGSDTASQFEDAAASLKSRGAQKFVIDLRDNPGGYLDSAVKIAGVFLDNKLVVEEKKGSKSESKLYATRGGLLVGVPVIVIINEGSASASEILAGAMRDHQAAKLLGSKSFGKGSVQEIISLKKGAKLKVTVAHWYTPGGKNISSEGIAPDIEVKMTAEDYDKNLDPQLDAALKL